VRQLAQAAERKMFGLFEVTKTEAVPFATTSLVWLLGLTVLTMSVTWWRFRRME
jgi:ABC-type transport system involved in multi-copper enzyme maturation permease subunit